jgi:hypothetical protein
VKNEPIGSSLEDMVLVWLVVPRKKSSKSDLVKTLAPMFEDDRAPTRADIDNALKRLDSKRYMDEKTKRERLKPPLRLNVAGRQPTVREGVPRVREGAARVRGSASGVRGSAIQIPGGGLSYLREALSRSREALSNLREVYPSPREISSIYRVSFRIYREFISNLR